MSYYHNNTQLPLDRPFTLNDEQFGANWLRLAGDDDKEKRGIEWRDDPQRQFKNEQFYYNTVDSDGNVVSTPKDVDMLKRNLILSAKTTAHSLLSGSDWMVVREVEQDLSITNEWAEFRQSVRAECERQEDHINASPNVESLETMSCNWPESPDDKAERERREAEDEAAKLEKGLGND